jgi:hypothetical protein
MMIGMMYLILLGVDDTDKVEWAWWLIVFINVITWAEAVYDRIQGV